MNTYCTVHTPHTRWLVSTEQRSFYEQHVFPRLKNMLSDCVFKKITRSRYKETVMVRIPVNARDGRLLVFKRYYYPGVWRKIHYLFKQTKGMNEYTISEQLVRERVSVVAPECVGEMRQYGFPLMSLVFFNIIEHAADCEELLKELRYPGRVQDAIRYKRLILQKLARLVKKIHDAGFYQYDCNPCNFLVEHRQDEDPFIYCIDFGRMQEVSDLNDYHKIDNLAKLNCFRSWLTNQDRLYFLKHYDPQVYEERKERMSMMRAIEKRSDQIIQRRERKIREELGRDLL